jgi:hypothetical protein
LASASQAAKEYSKRLSSFAPPLPLMAEINASKGTTANKQPMDNCYLDVMKQMEKKADFLYHVADTYVYTGCSGCK